MAIICECGQCGKKYKVGDQFAGKAIACKQCHGRIEIPASDGAYGLQDLSGLAGGAAIDSATPPPVAPAARRGATACPGCGAPSAPGAVICVNCGYNFSTGQRLSTQVHTAPPPIPAPRAARRAAEARDREDAAADSGGINSWALTFSLFAIGAPLLPLAGRQFILLAIFGDFAPFMGLPCGVVAAILWFRRGSTIMGAGSIVASLVALGIAFAYVPTDVGENQPENLEARVTEMRQKVQALQAEVDNLEKQANQLRWQLSPLEGQVMGLRFVRSDAERARLRNVEEQYKALNARYKEALAKVETKREELHQLRNSLTMLEASHKASSRE